MFIQNLFLIAISLLLSFYSYSQNSTDLFLKASKANDTALLKTLIHKGIDVNSTSEYGATALTFAIDKQHTETVRILLENGADPNKKDLFYQASSFAWSLRHDNVEIVKLMVKYGADISNFSTIQSLVNFNNIELFEILIEKDSSNGGTLLYGAIKIGNIKMIELALNKTEINPESLKMSVLLACALENQEIINLLKTFGAKIPEKTKNPTDKIDFNQFIGNYENQNKQNLEITILDNNLVVYFYGSPYRLMHIGNLKFRLIDYPTNILVFKKYENEIVGIDYFKDGYQKKYIKVLTELEINKAKLLAEDTNSSYKVSTPLNWPSFRGNQASGNGDGQYPPSTWDAVNGDNLKWKTYVPGLAHACPIIWEDKVFVVSAMSNDSVVEFRHGIFGDVEPAEDTSSHVWKIYCINKSDGKIQWEKKAYEGIPRVKRHTKGTHANATPVTNGKYIIALFGSEGMVCYDMSGNEIWRKDLGKIDAGWFFNEDTEWGPSSSPIIYKNYAIVQVDRSKDCFIAAYDLKTGTEVWKTNRDEISSWGTPTIYLNNKRNELITNGTKKIRSYNPDNGEELWTLSPNSEITVATPVLMDDLVFITGGYRPVQPVYAIKLGGTGDISIADSLNSGEHIKWRTKRGGTYMPTPIVYREYLYTCANNGTIICYNIETGKKVYKERLRGGAFTASPIAADNKLYFVSEEKGIYVVKAGAKFELISINPMGEICMATPAISNGLFFVRGQHHLFCFGR